MCVHVWAMSGGFQVLQCCVCGVLPSVSVSEEAVGVDCELLVSLWDASCVDDSSMYVGLCFQCAAMCLCCCHWGCGEFCCFPSMRWALPVPAMSSWCACSMLPAAQWQQLCSMLCTDVTSTLALRQRGTCSGFHAIPSCSTVCVCVCEDGCCGWQCRVLQCLCCAREGEGCLSSLAWHAVYSYGDVCEPAVWGCD